MYTENLRTPGKSITFSASDTAVSAYLKRISRFKILTKEEELKLGEDIQLLVKINKLKKEFSKEEILKTLNLKDETELNKLVKRGRLSHEKMFCANLRLVVFRAKRYLNRGLPLEDLIEEGNLGLHTACYRFDPNYGTKLSTYAVPWINHAIQVSIKKQSLVIYRPYSFNIELAKITQTTKELNKELGRPPKDIEIARKLKIKPSRLRQIRLLTQTTLSLDTKIAKLEADGKTFLDFCYEDTNQNPEEYVDSLILKEKITEALEFLEPDEKIVLSLRFGLTGLDSKTISEVSSVVNRTRESIRQLENKALEKIRWQRKLEDFQ